MAEIKGAANSPESGTLVAADQMSGNGQLVFSDAHIGFSGELGVITDLPRDDAGRTVAAALNTADKLGIGAGLVLLKQQATLPHGTFGKFLADFGIARQRAHELMAIADVLAKASPDDRKRLLGQPKTILIGMARMDDDVRADLLATGKLNEKLTLAEYRELVSDKDKLLAAAESRVKALDAELARTRLTGKAALDLATPLAVVQIRRDAAALAITAQEAMHDFSVLVNRVTEMGGDPKADQWARALSVSLVSALQGLQATIDDQMRDAVEAFGLDAQIPARTEIAMAVPGREEAELIRSAMEGVMVGIERERTKRAHDNYVEQRERAPTKGAYRKDPTADSATASRSSAKRR
ncbi:MAG: hypothetical protein RL375_4569 [Pseudomonadota bacterium]